MGRWGWSLKRTTRPAQRAATQPRDQAASRCSERPRRAAIFRPQACFSNACLHAVIGRKKKRNRKSRAQCRLRPRSSFQRPIWAPAFAVTRTMAIRQCRSKYVIQCGRGTATGHRPEAAVRGELGPKNPSRSLSPAGPRRTERPMSSASRWTGMEGAV